MYVLSFCFTVAFMSLFLICIVEKDYCFYISALSEVIIILDLYIINTKDTEYWDPAAFEQHYYKNPLKYIVQKTSDLKGFLFFFLLFP